MNANLRSAAWFTLALLVATSLLVAAGLNEEAPATPGGNSLTPEISLPR